MKNSIYNRIASRFVDFLNGEDDSMKFADMIYNLEKNGGNRQEIIASAVAAIRTALMDLVGDFSVVDKMIDNDFYTNLIPVE